VWGNPAGPLHPVPGKRRGNFNLFKTAVPCSAKNFLELQPGIPVVHAVKTNTCLRVSSFSLILLAFILALGTAAARAGSAVWNLDPGSSDWNTASNWTPATIPSSSTDIATFGLSNNTQVFNGITMQLGEITFVTGAPSYTITAQAAQLSFYGGGVVNNSGAVQGLSAINDYQTGLPAFVFYNSAISGSSTTYALTGGAAYFFQSSNAST